MSVAYVYRREGGEWSGRCARHLWSRTCRPDGGMQRRPTVSRLVRHVRRRRELQFHDYNFDDRACYTDIDMFDDWSDDECDD